MLARRTIIAVRSDERKIFLNIITYSYLIADVLYRLNILSGSAKLYAEIADMDIECSRFSVIVVPYLCKEFVAAYNIAVCFQQKCKNGKFFERKRDFTAVNIYGVFIGINRQYPKAVFHLFCA